MRVFLVLLIASLGLNAYLIVKRRSGSRPDSATIERTRRPPMTRPLVRAPLRPTNDGTLERAALEQRVLQVEAEVEKHLRSDEKYTKYERSAESEARVKPYLDLVFKNIRGDGPKYKVECHARVCKVDAQISNDWVGPLQRTYPERTMFGTMSFSSPDKTYVELLTDGEALASRIRYEAARGIDACAIANPAPGQLVIQLTMDSARRVIAEVSGSLADQPAGRCVRTALQGAIAMTPVPPNVQIEDEPRTLEIPLE
jgi:hypothetical protein